MEWKTAILMMLVGAMVAPQAAATSLGGPAVNSEALPEGYVVTWDDAGTNVDSWVVEVWHDGVLEDVVELPASADSYVNPAPDEGLFEYRVAYEEDGTTTHVGTTNLHGYPWCLNVIVISTSWPFLKVHEECLLPPPV